MAGKLEGSPPTSYRPSKTSQLRSLLQRTSVSITIASLLFCIRELAIGLSFTGPAHSPTSPLPPSSCMLHQQGITPGSGVEPVKRFSLKAQLPPQRNVYSFPLGSRANKWPHLMIFTKSGLLEGDLRKLNDCDPKLEMKYDYVQSLVLI